MGQLSMTKSKYSSFMSKFHHFYFEVQFVCSFQCQVCCIPYKRWTFFLEGRPINTDLVLFRRLHLRVVVLLRGPVWGHRRWLVNCWWYRSGYSLHLRLSWRSRWDWIAYRLVSSLPFLNRLTAGSRRCSVELEDSCPF